MCHRRRDETVATRRDPERGRNAVLAQLDLVQGAQLVAARAQQRKLKQREARAG
jgi:hypothetical protein